jgi:hypothetical protein
MDGAKSTQDRSQAGPDPDGAGCRKWLPLDGSGTIWQATAHRQGVPLRSVALRLPGGGLAVYSPLRGLGAEAHAELRRIGRPELLVAPNHYHHLGLPEYAAAYPEAAIVSSSAASARLRRKSGRPVGDEAPLRAALPAGASILLAPGARAGELWLSTDTARGRAWIVGDGFFNIARTPRDLMGLLLVALGISPGLRIGTSYRWLLRDRVAYRAWLLELLDRQPPTVLVPCHGEILFDPALPARLRQLAETRL